MSDYKERIDAVLSKVGNKDNNYDYTSAYKDRIDAVLKRIEDEPNAKASNEEDGYMHTINMVRGLASHLKQNANPKEDDIPHLSEDTHMARDTQRRMLRVAPDDERGKELRNKVDTWNAEAVPQAIERLSIGEAGVNPRIRPESPRVQRDYDVQNGRGERVATEIAREQKARETSLENLYDYSSAQAKEITRKYANDTNPEMSESERSELERYLTKQIYTTAFENNIDESGRYWATAYELSTGKNYKEFEKAETTKARDRQKEIAKELEAILAELEQKKEESHNNAGQSRGFFSSVENDYKTPYGTEYEIAEDALDHVNDLLTGTLVSAIKAEYNFTSMASFGRGRTYENEAINESLGKLYSGESLNEYDEYVIKIKQLEAEADMLQDFRSQHGDVVHEKWFWGHVDANELGKGIGTTLEKAPEFAASMYGTRGLGSFQKLSVKAALKAGQKDLVQYGINTIGKNYALAKARGFAAAPFMSSTYGEYFKSLNSGYSFDENGGIHYKPVDKTQAYLGAVISNANEISSEYIGVGFSEALGWGARSVGNMVANSKVGGAIVNGVRKVTPNLTPQAKTAMLTFGVQADPVAETLGEAWGDIMTTFEGGLIGKEVDLGEYFTMDYWTTLSGVSILYGGTMAAMGAVKSYRDVNKAVKERDGILGEVINRNLYNTLVAISTSDDVVLASSALADFDWKGNYDNAQDMKAEMERARAYVVADLNVKVMEGVVSETSRLESFRGTIEGVRNIVYQNKAGKYSDIIREAEMDGKKVYIINGYEANTNQYIVVDATTGEKTSVDKSKVKPTRELDVDTYIVESYKNAFSLETEKQRIADVKAKALQLDNPTEKDVARIASTLGIALPKVGNTVMLANGNMGAVTEVLSPTEYAVQDPSGATYKVHFTDILSTDKLTATAQGALARGEVAAPIASAPQTETTPDTISPDENGITIGAEVTVDGRVGKVRARTQDGKYAVAFEAENGNYEDTEMEFFTGEELASLMGIAPAPTAETPEVAETAPTEMATTEDGSVDIEQMSAEDAARVLVQRAGTIEEAKAQVKQVIETVAEERKKTAKAEKKASLNDIGKKSAELQALDTRLEFYGEVLAALEGMLAEQQKQTMTEAQNVAEEAGVAPEATDAPDKTTEENKPVEQPTSGLIRNGAEMKFTDNVIKMVDFVAKRLGITVEFVNGLKNEAGQPINGDITGKRVRISTSGTKGIKFIMGHEFFHRMKDLVDEQTYADFVNSIKEYAGEKVWKATMAHQRNVYRNHNARVVKEVMAKMSIDDVAKIAARLNVNIEGLSLENAKDAVIDGAVMGKEKGIAEVNAIFPKMLSYDDVLMVEECAADVAGALVTNTKTFAKYVEDNSSNIPLVRGLRKAIRAMRDFFDSFGYTDQQRKLNALEQSLAGALKEAVAKEAKGIPSPVSSPSTTASNVTPQGVEPAQTENVPEEYADLGKSETAPIYNDGIVDTEAYTDALELARHLNEEWAGDREGAIGRLEFKLNAVEIAAHNARVYAKGEDVSVEDRAKYQQEAAEYDRQAKVYEEALAYLKKPAQPKFSLIGEVGAEALDRAEEATTRLDNLAVAREMENAGKDAKAIRMATGWERGADGLWRYEIMDAGVNLYDGDENTIRKKIEVAEEEEKDFMQQSKADTKELRERTNTYLAEMREKYGVAEGEETDVMAEEEIAQLQSLTNKEIEFEDYKERRRYELYNRRMALEAQLAYVMVKNTDAPAMILTSRLGHVLKGEYAEQLFKAYPSLKDMEFRFVTDIQQRAFAAYAKDGGKAYIELNVKKTPENMVAPYLMHEVQHAIQDIEGFAEGGSPAFLNKKLSERLNAVTKELEKLRAEGKTEEADALVKLNKGLAEAVINNDTDDYGNYQKLMGEVEARNVSARINMTPEERLNTLLSETEDVAREDQIFLREGAEMAMAQPKFLLSEETTKIFDAAKAKFGTTYDMREAGYILPDGSMLDFSGRHQVEGDASFLNGDRTVDHREISDIAYDTDGNETGVNTDLGDFLDRGAIRIDSNAGAINLNVAPTKAQKDRLKRLIERNDGYVYIDFGKGWDTEHYAEYEAARASRVLGDIDRYFDEGIKPTGNVKFSLITPEMDASYLDAVERGDMATAQKMVMEAAKLAMPNTKVVDEDGNPKVVYHGTDVDFWVFNPPYNKYSFKDFGANFFTDDKKNAMRYGAKIKPVFLDLTDPDVFDANDQTYNEFSDNLPPFDGWSEAIIQNIKDAPEGKDRRVKPANTYVVGKNINYQIKSADTVTYDDNGNVIPLSERFNPKKEDIRYSLIGEQGASTLDAYEEATTRLDNLNVAREMEAQGKDALAIKQATGWERGKDGLWRYEVADYVNMFDFTGNVDYMRRHPEYRRYKELLRKRNVGMMFFKKGLTKEEQKEFDDLAIVYGNGVQPHNSHKLKDYLDSEELFAAYPQLRDINVEIKKELEDGYYGRYIPSRNTIELATRTHEYMARTLFHEVQHAIQHIEGFANGGNTEIADPRKVRERKEAMEGLQRKIDMHERALERFEAELSELNDSMEKWWQSHPEAMSREDFDSEMQALSEVYDAQLKKAEREQNKLRETQKEYKKLVESSATLGYEGYERLAGEVEARATARRVGMSEEERRNTLQLNDEDIARKDQIILRNGLFENYADANPRFHLPDPDPNDVFYDEIPIFDEQGNEVDITTLTSEEAKEILDGKVRQMLEAEYDHAVVSIRKEAEEARQAVKEVYRAEKEKRRKGAKAARTNAARIDEIFGDTPFESLPYEVQALILIATGEAKIYWGDRGNKRGLASELGLTGSTGDRHAYRNIWGGAKKSFNEVVHDWWESIGGQERGIDDQDLRNALISALQSVQSSRDAMQEIINKYDDLAEDRDNTLAEIDRNEEKELYEAKSAYEQHLANFELSEGEERIAYRDRAAQFFGNQSLSRVDDILEDLTNELERSKRKIERLKAEKKDVYTPLAESIQKAKDTVLRALERLRMFAGMEEVDLNDVARLINLVKASRSQRQIENLGAQTTALVQRVSIKKAKTNLMRLLSLKLSNTDIIHKMLKESDTWTKEEREAILKHLWKVSRNGLLVSKAVHKDTKEIVGELKSLVDAFRKNELKGLNDAQKAKIIEAKLAEVEKELHPEVVYDSEGNVQDNADLPTDFNAENKHLAKFFFKSYLDMLAKEMEYHNAAAELHEKIDNKDKTDGANTAMVVARENYLNALNQFNSSLESLILEGKDKLRDWNAQKEQHEIEIRSMGIRAIGGKKASGQGKVSSKMARARARINTTVNAPYWTFETVLEKIDHNSPYKKGKLYTYFMDMWADANDDLINRYAAHMEEIAGVMRKCFPDDAKNILRMKRNPYALYQYIMRKAESTPIGTLTYKEMGEDGQIRDAQIVLNVANAMYVIAMWRQPRYQEAMQEKHGITQGDIDALMANIASLNAGFLDFMDWVNDTFLPSTRLEYDVVYRKMNGGSMPKEINYFPARVAGHKEVDLANIDNGALPTTPSALKDRMSAHIMPQLGMDYFKVLESHIQDMDNWAAYAELTADLNVLLSSDEFRRRCNDYMGGLGGDGGGKGSLYDLFKQTSLIATGMYRGDAGMEALLGQLQKAWATSNIAFRGWTAVKQISSITTGMFDNWAFYKHAGIAATGIGIYHEIKNAMEISPSLRYRWKSGAAGMEALARETQREDGYTVQRGAYEKGKDFIGDAIKTLVRAGMTPNAAVDLLACSIIVNSVYETEIARLTGGKREATEEEKRAAVRKAERAFNTTQQSSEGAYLAPVQANPAYGVLTTYMNASFALHRKRMGGIKELWKLATSKKYRRYLKDEFGVDAAKISAKDAFKDILSGVAGELSFAMMGWGLMKVMTVINGWLNEDDDDEDVAAAKQEFFDSWWQSLLNGYLGGSVVSSWINGFDTSLTPAYDEFAKDVYRLTDDKGSVLWELGTMFTKYGIGIDLESLYKSAAAIENMYEDDERAGAVLMFLNAPDRYVKAFVGDRREGETLDEYTTRVGRTYALLEEIKFDEKGKPVGGGVYENFVPKSRYNGLDKVFEEEYREDMLKKYGGDKGYADYTMADLKHKQICGLLDWDPNATPSEEKVQTDMQDELEYYQKRVAKAIRKRKDWVGDDEGYYDLLMDEQEAKNDLINNYYEYIKQAGLGTY